MNYDGLKFRPVLTTDNGETSVDTIFHYQQTGNILTAQYSGGDIVKGYLIGLVDKDGLIDMRYHQVSKSGDLMTGICKSTPEMLPNGKIRLHEEWQWTSGDLSSGKSILESC